jgi:restriction system protein
MVWEIEVHHEGLNKYRHIKGSDRYIVEQKANSQRLIWDEMWEKKQVAEQKKEAREAEIRSKEEKKELAITKTNDAQKDFYELENILLHTLRIDDAVDWDSLLDGKKFQGKKPDGINFKLTPPVPNRSDAKYKASLGFFDKIFSKSRKRKEDEAKIKFRSDYAAWKLNKDKIAEHNKNSESDYLQCVKNWESNKLKHEDEQKRYNEKILKKKKQYLNKEQDAIYDYCEMVLTNSEYPDYFPQDWDIEYQTDSNILIVDYSLPDIDCLPTVKTTKYIISRDEYTETHLSNASLNKLYDSLLYQIALRTIHELYEADVVNALESIIFNGWVDTVDKATGHNVNSCIMSIQATKDEFLAINLEKVEPKASFNQLKGIGSSKLHGLSPVAPIANINKEDRRFVSAYDIVDEIDETNNLAAMDWQDFENLIREIFEKEFASSGGEVKITQASRDGGVDAIAFDPDPIRGGKIVIQAKRYTNVVGVSAVRDLFGTTVNEGAIKGILVTTANFGPDAYEFVKGKPLTLLNGSNLLHLLEKHGYRAKIDIKEAKRLMAEQQI